MTTNVYLGPVSHPEIVAALESAGASLVPASEAEFFAWTDPYQPKQLLSELHDGVKVVALPIAGVERYVAAGVIDDKRMWTAAKGVYSSGVSEHAVALLLACGRNLGRAVRRRAWVDDPGFRLAGKKVVVLGTGGIGCAVARKLAPFDVDVVGVNRSGRKISEFSSCAQVTELRDQLTAAHALIVAIPSTESTKRLVGAAELEALGPEGVVVNVARGDVIDSDALVEALQNGVIAGAGLDVFDPEPLPEGHPLWDHPNVVITAHNANPFVSLPWDCHVTEFADYLARVLRGYRKGEIPAEAVNAGGGY